MSLLQMSGIVCLDHLFICEGRLVLSEMLVKLSEMEMPDGSLAMQVWLPNETLALPELGNNPDTKMPKEKRPISSDDSDSGPEDRAPLPKSQKKSLHKVF